MPTPRILNLDQQIARIPQHAVPLPPEAASPIEHYRLGANEAWNLLVYFRRNITRTNAYAAVLERHLLRLRAMVLLSIVEAFERYIKEVAALCIDHVVPRVLDDRASVLRVQSRSVAAHFSEKSLGKALCEGETWLDCDDINKRFGKLLADPFSDKNFQLFPGPKDGEAWRRVALDTLFQLRHSIVHNAGVITNSDAAKLRLLTRATVKAPTVLSPTAGDLWSVKMFMDHTAAWINDRVAERLCQLLTTLHASDKSLFDASETAAAIASQFGLQATIDGTTAQP